MPASPAVGQACEAVLADHLESVLARGELPSIEVARLAVAPTPAIVPCIVVHRDPAVYDCLVAHRPVGEAA